MTVLLQLLTTARVSMKIFIVLKNNYSMDIGPCPFTSWSAATKLQSISGLASRRKLALYASKQLLLRDAAWLIAKLILGVKYKQ